MTDTGRHSPPLEGQGEVSMTFWDHLDELRGVIIKSLVVMAVAAAVAVFIWIRNCSVSPVFISEMLNGSLPINL